jgi:plastocyanin
MKKTFFLATLALMIAFGLSALPTTTKANNLESKLSGRILLAVESNGETWYINPENQQRYLLRDSLDTLNIMQQSGLGISNNDFNSFNGKAPLRLSGRILIKVQSLGEAYYVNPIDLKMHYLGKPDQALKLMQSLSLGITNVSLARIVISESVNVSITNSNFNPATLTVNKGTMVTWTNFTNISQTVTSPSYFNFGEIASGKTYSRMFNVVGTYNYYSTHQSGLTGTIIVK